MTHYTRDTLIESIDILIKINKSAATALTSPLHQVDRLQLAFNSVERRFDALDPTAVNTDKTLIDLNTEARELAYDIYSTTYDVLTLIRPAA